MKRLFQGTIILCSILFILVGCNKEQQNDNNNNSEEEQSINDQNNNNENSNQLKLMDGNWAGSINTPGEPLPIFVTFKNGDDISGQISIPIQGMTDYPFSSIKTSAEEVTFSMDIQGQKAIFNGEVSEESIEGTFTQHGQSFPFALQRDDSDGDEVGEFLEIETELGTLYGELHMPTDVETAPVMLIIPGSGNTDRNGNSAAGKNNSLKYVAEELGEHGIASLRFDKRGAGKNSEAIGEEEDFRFEQYVKDAVGWVELLESDERFESIGIIGHSEGSLVGILAAQETAIDSFISLAGAGRPIVETLLDQIEAAQLPDELLEESKTIIEQLKQGEQVQDVSNELYSLFRPSVQPYMISWMQYDPAEELEKLDVPVLIVNGQHDIQVSADEAEILAKAKPDADLLIIEEMNHILKEAPTDRAENMATYTNPNLPLAEGLMKGITQFLEEHV